MPHQSQDSQELTSRPVRPRRSVLFMPGSNARVLEKARGLPTDAVILDLEDAVTPEAKDEARQLVCAAIKTGFGKREVIVRINAADSEWGERDLIAVAEAGPDAVLVPKIHGASDLARVSRLLPRAIAVWAMIETPHAVLDAHAIAGAGGSLSCLVLGSNDLLKDLGAIPMRDRANLTTAMSLTVLAARAHGLAVIDGVYNNFNDTDGFAAACRQARGFGFDGKALIHPNQIAPCNSTFAPSADELAAARKVIAAFDLPENRGKGAISLDGRMVERLHADSARRVVAMAEAIAALG